MSDNFFIVVRLWFHMKINLSITCACGGNWEMESDIS